jgi:mono/diheme cytochrome c family protein
LCDLPWGGDGEALGDREGRISGAPQLASEGVDDDPEGWAFWKIKHGIRLTGMPAWKVELDDTQIWTLALFLEHTDKLPPTAEAAWRTLREPTAASPVAAGAAAESR